MVQLEKNIVLVLGKLGITTVAYLWDSTSNTWKPFSDKLTRLQNIPADLKDLIEQFLIATNRWHPQLRTVTSTWTFGVVPMNF